MPADAARYDAAVVSPLSPSAARSLMLLGFLAFLQLGAFQALYGPSFVAFGARHGVGLGEVGLTVSLHFLGAFVGTVVSSFAVGRFGYRRLLVASPACSALGGALLAFAPFWALALAGAATAGLGYGLGVVLYNFLFARAFGKRGTAAVNVINGAFGIGAVAAPALAGVLMAAFAAPAGPGIERVLSVGFGASALLALVVTTLAARLPWSPPAVGAAPGRAGGFPFAGAFLFASLFFVYVAVEVSTAAWAPTHLGAFMSPALAAASVSVFWIAMTVGRFAAAAVATRLRPQDLVAGGVVVGILGILLAHLPTLAFAGYALAGLGLGPVFPTTVAWVQRRFGERAEAVGSAVIAAGNLGPAIGAPAIGLAAAAVGAAAIPSVLAGVLVALLLLVGVAWWGSRASPAVGAGG
jgi:MFS transporter, FHS family, glucose/mannose:H+ symporter